MKYFFKNILQKEPAFRSTRGSDLTAKTQSTKLSVNKHRRFFQVKRTVSRAPTTSEVQEHVSSPRSSSQDGQTTIVCKRGRPKSREPKKNTHIINRLRARALGMYILNIFFSYSQLVILY